MKLGQIHVCRDVPIFHSYLPGHQLDSSSTEVKQETTGTSMLEILITFYDIDFGRFSVLGRIRFIWPTDFCDATNIYPVQDMQVLD